ncbi:ankyrin repeat domain-containing protein 29-like isoform X2 [Crassostrea angulata]|nr:ankyrin repeat domain-containing protein 29-like isoform X2 [Crassostrea angulata]
MCVPNENITELLEFCYSLPQIRIVKGLCMFLYKHHSILDAYECSHFTEGCPDTNYRSQDVHIYQSCVSIANGCFLADPTCNRTTTVYPLANSTTITANTQTLDSAHQESADWAWMVTLSGVTAILFIALCILSLRIIIIESNKKEKLIKTESKNNDGLKNRRTEKRVFSSLRVAFDKGKGDEVHHCVIEQGAINDAIDQDGSDKPTIACNNRNERNEIHFLKNDSDLNLRRENEDTPFFTACALGNESIVQLLLKNGADINLCKNDGASALFLACQNGHDNVVQLLLENGAHVNLCMDNSTSPLCVASYNGHVSTVKLLLTNGADINLCKNDGASALFLGCQNGHDNVVQLLLENGANANLCMDNSTSPLCVASYNGHVSTVKLLLTNGADINSCKNDGASALFLGCQNGHDNVVQLLLENGADINLSMNNGSSPLSVACHNGHDSTVQLLLANCSDVN